MSDNYQMPIIQSVKDEKSEGDKLWKCFALLCLKDLDDKDKISVINYYIQKGIYLIFVDNFSELPKTLDELMNFNEK